MDSGQNTALAAKPRRLSDLKTIGVVSNLAADSRKLKVPVAAPQQGRNFI